MIKKSYNFYLDQFDKNEIILKRKDSEHICRIMVLEEDIVRVLLYRNQLELDRTWAVAPGLSDVPTEGRNRLDISVFSCPGYQFEHTESQLRVFTDRFILIIELDGLKMSWYKNNEGSKEPFAQDRETQAYNFDGELGRGICHYMKRKKNDMYFGLGEKSGLQNRYGGRYIMKNLDAMGYDAFSSDPLYKHIPFFMVKDKATHYNYGIFYDNFSDSVFDMGKEHDNYHGLYRYYQASHGDIDYYMIMGDSLSHITQRFSWLTGRTLFSPKWSLGYSGSTMQYTDADNADEMLIKFVEKCREHDILCSSFQLSSGYTSIGEKRYVFNWNYDKIPDPQAIADYFNKNGIKLCANIKPALLIDHPMFSQLKAKEMFIKDREGNYPEIAMFWDELAAYIDFTNPESYNWWKSQVIDKLLKMGITSTWNDNNEYEIWDDKANVNFFGKQTDIAQIKPILTMLMLKSSMDAQKEYAPNLRPHLISRSGCPGIQRYVQTWSGDNYTSFDTLKYNIKMGIGLSLCGIYNIGHDVGGFAGPKPSEELFIRWVQQGIFWPRFTIHSWNDDGTVNEPWMYEKSTHIIRNLIKLRAKILPYIYQLLYRSSEYYEPMIRPTFYRYEIDEKAFMENDEFMLGDSLLIAPVVEEGAKRRKVYLPAEENGWYDYNTNAKYQGGQIIEMDAGFEDVPLLVRGGSIIPINTAACTFDTKDSDKRGFLIYPIKKGLIKLSCYEDDGLTNNYMSGEFAFINVYAQCSETSIIISYSKEGNFDIDMESITFEVMGNDSREVIIQRRQPTAPNS